MNLNSSNSNVKLSKHLTDQASSQSNAKNANDPEVVFNLFINRLIGPSKVSSFYFSPQLIGGGISPQEKTMMQIMESCPFKCAISGVGGLGIGAIFGLFTASVDPMYTINPNKIPTMKEVALEMKNRAWSTGKNFAVIGLLFSAIECNVESYRGKTDLYNGFISGCLTGGVLGLRAGVKAGMFGSLSFGLFSLGIEYMLMSRH